LPDKPRDVIIKEWESRLPEMVEWIKVHTSLDKKAPISPDVVSAISVVGLLEVSKNLYESSKKIESYSRTLKWLTVALVLLTIVLAIRTFFP
jgi:hypothetical protein